MNALKLRREISAKFMKEFKGTVKYGPISGFQFSELATKDKPDRTSILFGLYEDEVVSRIVESSKNFSTFADIGAAEGIYAVGLVFKKYFDKSICFEIEERLRKILVENSKVNECTEKVQVNSEFKTNTASDFGISKTEDYFVLVDIEGAEFELIDEAFLDLFKSSQILIELHDWMFKDGEQKKERLIKRLTEYMDIEVFTSHGRNPNQYPELSKLKDDYKWIACSEGRRQAMEWIHAKPKS
ncbi:MAG: hypothetical protein ACPGN3_11835 [Opitutales bacterium]